MMRITVTYKGPGPGETKRALKRAARVALVGVISFWHNHLLPKHFTVPGFFAYKYKSRGKFYNRRKRRIKGHSRPLVFNGDTESMALGRVEIRTTANRGKGLINVPWYIKQSKHFRSKSPDMADELTRITSGEYGEMTKILETEMTKLLNNPEG